jgi:predicted outer membrane repeat protein
LDNITLKHCRAKYGGGLLLDEGAEAQLLDCNLNDNAATSSGGHVRMASSGLIVHSKGAKVTRPSFPPNFPNVGLWGAFVGSTFSKGAASLSGGAIACMASFSDKILIVGSECQSTGYLYADDTSGAMQYACLSKGVFLGRKTMIKESTAIKGGGGAVSANLCSVVMSNTSIVNATSILGDGGAILVSMESTLHVDDNSEFKASNALQGSGGAVSCEECGSMFFSGGTVFQSNSAQKSGGAIYLSSPTKPIVSTGSKYKDNSATQLNGGAVDMHGGTNWTSIGDSFDGNVALSGSGGALSSFGSHIQFDAASLCVRNQAPKGGGGCLLWEPNAAHLKDSAWGKFAPVVSNLTVIQENNALYGISFATPGASLRIVNTTKMFVTNDKNMLFPRYPFVEILDYYGTATQGRISKDIDVVAKLHGNSHAKLFGATTSRTNNHGRAAFSGLGLQGIPSTKHELYFEASLNLLGTIRARFLNTSSLLPTSIQMCGVGLFLSDVKLQCEYCPANSILSLSDGIESKIGSRETLCLCNSDYYREISSNDLMTCLKCPARSIAPAGSTSIKNCKCNAGFYSTENHAACVIADWVTSDQCDAFSFLNDTSPNKYDWRCLRCPRGGSCYGLTTASNLLPSTGYWQCPTDPQKFVKCKGDGSMCIGRNVSTSIYNQNRSSMCNSRGRYNPSTNNMLCLTCQVGWVPGGRYGCVFCKNPNAKTALLAIAGSFCVFFFVLLIVFKVKSTGRALAVHSTLKRTVFTHLQMLAIVISLNVQFPPVVVSFIDGLSAVILDIGRSSDAHCSSALPGAISSAANLHYGMLITSVLSPILVSLLAFVYWIILVPACPHVRCLTCFTTLEYWNPLQYHSKPQKQKRTNRKLKSKRKIQINKTPQKSQQRRHRSASLVEFERKKSTLDIFFATLVFFGYLTLPIIVRLSLRTFLSESVCGNVYFATDFAVNYTSDLHVFMMMGVALPSVILYGFVTTSLVFVYMMKNQHLLETRRMTFRIGLLYSGFRKSTWWWEALVFVRKISVILVATFIEHPYLQLMFSWGILFLLVVAQLSWKPMSPYSTKAHARCPDMLHIVEMSSLLILMSMVWAASYFERDDNCSNNDPGCQVLGGFIILTNCLFLLICVGLFFGKFAKHHNFTRKLKSAQSFIQKRSQSKQNVFETKQQVDKRELSTGVEVNHLINMEHDMVSIELANGVRSNRGFGVINPLRKSSLKLRPDY